MVTTINDVLRGVCYEKRAHIVLDLVYNGDIFGDTGAEIGEIYAQNVMKKKVPAWKLCKAKDTAPQGCLNLQGLGEIQCVEELKKVNRVCLPQKVPFGEKVTSCLEKRHFCSLSMKQIITKKSAW